MYREKKLSAWNSDPWLLGIAIIMCLWGIIMVYSATHNMAQDRFHDPLFYLKKHLLSLGLGCIGLGVMTQISLETLRKLTFPLLFLAIFLLILLHVPGFGVKAGGALRWLKLGGFRVGQPAELAKIALVLYLAHSLERKGARIQEFWAGYVPPVVIAGSFIVLLMVQPDFGTSVMILVLTVMVLYVAGVPTRFLVGGTLLTLPGIYMLLITSPYRLRRILAFLDPFNKDVIQGDAYQLVQSLKAFASGGLYGLGLGFGKQKLGHLPESHTDFIFAVLGEELGLVGVLIFVMLILALMYRGFRIAANSHSLFGRYLAFGLSSMIGVQCLINLGVVMGSLPTKGMPLPFISFAKTSIIVILAAIGILLRVEYDNQRARIPHG